MRRRVIQIALLLLLGAIVNVAVAWAIAGFVMLPIRVGYFREWPLADAEAYWTQHAPEDWRGATIIEGNAVESWGFGRRDLLVIAEDAAGDRLLGISHDDTGWPSMALRFTGTQTVKDRVENADCQWCWQIDVSLLKSKTMPLRPLWPGFAINTVFYAFILWLFFAAPFALRRRRRIKRGLCPKCAYDLRNRPSDSSACPECGASLPSPSR